MILSKNYNDVVDETLYFGTHESRLKVYIMPKKGYSKTYAIFGTHFGSIDRDFINPDTKEHIVVPDGIAHFLEHKMFEQPDGTNVFESYAKYGANANAFTSFNMTAYLFECTQDVEKNLEILLDFVTKPYFTDENVAKEQGIIGQEIGMYDDDPGWRLMMNFLTAMYSEHPVNRDIAGTVETISKINKEILYKCYNTFYNVSNMVLFVIGDVEPSKIANCVDNSIHSSKPLSDEIERFYGNEPKSVRQSEITQKLDVSVPMFMLGFKDTDCGYDGPRLLKKSLELSILAEIVFGKSSEIYNRLYNDGDIMGSLDIEVECEKDYGHTVISGESKNPENVRKTVFSMLSQMKSIDEKAFERVKKSFWGRYIKQFNNINGIAHGFLSNIFNNINIFDMASVLEEIRPEDINKRLEQAYNTDESVLSTIIPQ